MEIHTPNLKNHLLECQAWAFNCLKNDINEMHTLVLVGDSGCGKTHILKCLEKYLRAAGSWAAEKRYWHAPPSSFRLNFADIADRPSSDPMWFTASTDVMFIDDVGSETDRFKSGQHVENLRRLLGMREHRWNVVTTNVPPNLWEEKWDSRVEDRLIRDSTIIMMDDVKSYAKWRHQQID